MAVGGKCSPHHSKLSRHMMNRNSYLQRIITKRTTKQCKKFRSHARKKVGDESEIQLKLDLKTS